MAVHSEMIYSNDDGNKSKVLLHIGLAFAFAGTVSELCLCYVKTITFTFQRVDSSACCLRDLMQSAISPAAHWVLLSAMWLNDT